MRYHVIIPDGTLVVYNPNLTADPYLAGHYQHGIIIAHHPTMGWGGTPAYDVLIDGQRLLLREDMVRRAGTRWTG